MIQLRGAQLTSDPRLDRVQQWDARSRDYPVRALLRDVRKPRTRRWPVRPKLDQGREGACVGFGWTHWWAAAPREHRTVREGTAQAVYRRAQQLDEWAGEQYEGTSVLAGAKAASELGWVKEYRWAFGLDDVLLALSHHGPVVMGTVWLDGMYEPDARGRLHVTGSEVGGHCWLARGLDTRRRLVLARNSWGADWGRGGDFLITWDDLELLLHRGGEACVPVEPSIRKES